MIVNRQTCCACGKPSAAVGDVKGETPGIVLVRISRKNFVHVAKKMQAK